MMQLMDMTWATNPASRPSMVRFLRRQRPPVFHPEVRHSYHVVLAVLYLPVFGLGSLSGALLAIREM